MEKWLKTKVGFYAILLDKDGVTNQFEMERCRDAKRREPRFGSYIHFV